MVGETLGHYRIEAKLGEGGMGVVYKARDTHLDRFVALKLLPPEKVAEPERKRRFVQEAKAASALNHPNIIHIYDIDSVGGVDFIAMEYVAGKTLDALIPRKGMRVGEALKCAVQIADALARAHAAGIIHRDLKPSNVMVDEHGLVKVLDFGLAKLVESALGREEAPTQTAEGAIMGTVAYMSPEQAQGLAVDARSDIFSFGSVLYEMVTGRRAFSGDTNVSTLAAVINREPEPLSSETPAELSRIITRCLRKDPARRFQHMDDVKVALEELKEESDSGKLASSAGLQPATARPKRALLGAAALAALLAGTAWWYVAHSGRKTAPSLKVVPLTSFAGLERTPALSADGKQIAFSWNGEKEDNFDIYVKLVDAGAPLRLTAHPAAESHPAWSPDGRFIAFVRAEPDPGYFMIPALGGAERKLADLPRFPPHAPTPTMDWSPDGKSLVIVDTSAAPASLALLSLSSGEKRKLVSPPAPSYGDFLPAVSPDGRWLAFVRFLGTGLSDLYRMPFPPVAGTEAAPKRLTFGNWNVREVAWTPDSREIIFSSLREGDYVLWRLATSGSGTPERVAALGPGVRSPSLARQGNRLAYVHSVTDSNIWRLPVTDPSARQSLKTGTGGSPARLIASTAVDVQAEYSPRGDKIVFLSARTGYAEVWIADADGSNPVQLTSFGGPITTGPRWSPDGRLIAFASRPEGNIDVYVINAQGGPLRRVTTEASEEHSARWSRDGKWIYFCSNRTGGYEVWKTPLDGSAKATQVTRNGGWVSQESPDGKFLYYAKFDQPGLWRMPLPGGEEIQVLSSSPRSVWAMGPGGIYFAEYESRAFRFLDFRTAAVTTLATPPSLERPGANHLSISPDGRWLLYTQTDRQTSDIMLVENFH